jgi:hypothetical protein
LSNKQKFKYMKLTKILSLIIISNILISIKY